MRIEDDTKHSYEQGDLSLKCIQLETNLGLYDWRCHRVLASGCLRTDGTPCRELCKDQQ
jgi:hypothetical protein